MRGAIPPLPHTPSWRGAQLNHRDKFTFIPLMRSLSKVHEVNTHNKDRYCRCIITTPNY